MIQGEDVFVAEGARVLGDVTVGDHVGIWFNAVIRGDSAPIRIGNCSNVQDNAVVHVNEKYPVVIGDYVTVGHGAIVHGCEIGDNTLVGMGAIILNGAKIGKNCLIAAGALVTENAVIPDGSMVMGMPGKVKRELTEEDIKGIYDNAILYVEEKKLYQ